MVYTIVSWSNTEWAIHEEFGGLLPYTRTTNRAELVPVAQELNEQHAEYHGYELE